MSRSKQNKEIVNKAFQAADNSDMPTFFSYLSEDFKWTTTGSTGVSGTFDKNGLIHIYFPKIVSSFKKTPKIIPDKIIADNHYVIRIGHGENGLARNGIIYNNQYCFIIALRDEKIISITEYCDTALVEKANLGNYLKPLLISVIGGIIHTIFLFRKYFINPLLGIFNRRDKYLFNSTLSQNDNDISSKNKEIVNAAFEQAERGNLEVPLNTLSQDFKWTTIGSTGVSGNYDAQGLLNDYFPKIAASFESMPIIVPDHIIADDNFVIRLGHGEGGVAKNGLEYNNIYCYVIELHKEKIKSITEYCDTALVEKAELGQY